MHPYIKQVKKSLNIFHKTKAESCAIWKRPLHLQPNMERQNSRSWTDWVHRKNLQKAYRNNWAFPAQKRVEGKGGLVLP